MTHADTRNSSRTSQIGTPPTVVHDDKRRLFLMAVLGQPLWVASGCAGASGDARKTDRSETPFVVEYALAPGAKNKDGVLAVTNTGAQLFASALLNPMNRGKSSFGGTVSFPTWVRVTWREGVTVGEYWTTGTVVADQTIEVSSRIPASFFEAAAAEPLRIIKLQFRIKDDKVLFAWCVQQTSKIGSGYSEILNDGDFKNPTKFNGVITDPGWER